jgi:hypothetical protein
MLAFAPDSYSGSGKMGISETANGHYDRLWSHRAVPENCASALGAEVFLDTSGFQGLPPIDFVCALDRIDVVLVEEARKPKSTACSLLALKTIAKRYAKRLAI